MRNIKLALLTLTVIAIGAVGATTAQASRGIRVSTSTITASGRLTLNAGATVCNVSLTLNIPLILIAKVTGTNQGTVTRGSITNCSGLASSGTVLTPINVQYRSFSGVLPRGITRITIIAPNAGFLLNTALAGSCLYGGALDNVGFPVTGGTTVSSVDFTGSSTLPKVSGGPFCPATGSITGSLTVSPPVTITLLN